MGQVGLGSDQVEFDLTLIIDNPYPTRIRFRWSKPELKFLRITRI